MKELGYGAGYERYGPDELMPEILAGTRFYRPDPGTADKSYPLGTGPGNDFATYPASIPKKAPAKRKKSE